MLSSVHDPDLDLISTCHLCLEDDGAIVQCLYALGFMPDLFLNIARNISGKPHLDSNGLSLKYTKARSHEIFQVKLLWELEVLPCLPARQRERSGDAGGVQHLDSINGKYPDLAS